MRLRVLYEAARLRMLAHGFAHVEATLPEGSFTPTMSYLDGRPRLLRTRERQGVAPEGDDPPLTLMLHGLGSSVATWSPVLARMATEVPLVAPDLPGYGRSPMAPDHAFATMSQKVQSVADLIDVLSPDAPVQLVGQSMGGWIAARLAADHPGRVSRLTLVNCAGILQPQVFEQRRLFTPSNRQELRHLWRAMWHQLPYSFFLFEKEYLGVTRLPHVRGFLDSVGEEDFLNDRLGHISAPTLLVWGLSDQLIAYRSVAALRAGIRDVRFRPIPDCGHIPQRECPEMFLRYVLPWLRGEEPPQPDRPGLEAAARAAEEAERQSAEEGDAEAALRRAYEAGRSRPPTAGGS